MVGLMAVTAFNMQAQPPSDSTPTYPSGATYVLSDGSTVTKTGETLESSTQYYNVVQVSNGTLTYSSLSGSGTINATTGIESLEAEARNGTTYTLDGLKNDGAGKGIFIRNGRKVMTR